MYESQWGNNTVYSWIENTMNPMVKNTERRSYFHGENPEMIIKKHTYMNICTYNILAAEGMVPMDAVVSSK